MSKQTESQPADVFGTAFETATASRSHTTGPDQRNLASLISRIQKLIVLSRDENKKQTQVSEPRYWQDNSTHIVYNRKEASPPLPHFDSPLVFSKFSQ